MTADTTTHDCDCFVCKAMEIAAQVEPQLSATMTGTEDDTALSCATNTAALTRVLLRQADDKDAAAAKILWAFEQIVYRTLEEIDQAPSAEEPTTAPAKRTVH